MDEEKLEENKGGKTEKPKKKRSETQLGYSLDQVASALQKEIRHGEEENAVYWALLLFGTAPQYAWKRVLVAAAEDIGLGDPDVVHKVCVLAQGWKIAKEQAYYVSPHHLTMAVMLLCRARKNTEAEDLQSFVLESIRLKAKRPMQDYSIDCHTEAGRAKNATVADWYDHRHFTFGVPVNRYTRKLAELVPDWFSAKLKDFLKKEE